MKENKFNNELEKMMLFSDSITENSELYQYIKQVNSLVGTDGEHKVFEKKYKKLVDAIDIEATDRPFLSVILRTQGSREEGLREALLCLRAQTCQNFEILLIGHKVEKNNKNTLNSIIDEQPESFKNRIRFIELNEGTRTVPINIGFANATGRYITIFDDDDLLFDDWVEKFHDAYKENDGKILHAYALSQKWKAFHNEYNSSATYYESIEAPSNQFCVEFDYLSQLVLNRCPLMSLAFPAYLFQKLGFTFNEELNVTEDWEYFMRVVAIAGIVDIKEATSIYRLWVNAETSATLHDQRIWLETYAEIQRKINSRALLLPRGYTNHIISLIKRCNEDDLNMPLGFPKLQGILFYENSYSYSDEKMSVSPNLVYSPQIKMKFDVPQNESEFRYFRIDPCEFGGFILDDVNITMNTENGGRISISTNEFYHNGINCEKGIYFVKYDPQIYWKYEGIEKIISIEFTGSVSMEIPETIVNAGIYYYSKLGKLERKIKNLVKRIIRR